MKSYEITVRFPLGALFGQDSGTFCFFQGDSNSEILLICGHQEEGRAYAEELLMDLMVKGAVQRPKATKAPRPRRPRRRRRPKSATESEDEEASSTGSGSSIYDAQRLGSSS